MGRTVVVTGANSGIGSATVTELARAGYDVIGTARTAEKAASVIDVAAAADLTVRTVLLDVADADSTRAGFEEIDALTDGGPWAVVNNAGIAVAGAVEDVDDDDARRQLEVNLLAPARIARLVMPGMRERGDGRIVMVSSIAGRTAVPLLGWYCASKHALEALTDALRVEVADCGVRVVLVEPGAFGTGIWAGAHYPEHPATSAYAAAYERARTTSTAAADSLMPDPIWVARTIRVALANPLPMARYLVGVDAVGGLVADKLAPTLVSDWVKGVGAGVRRWSSLGFGR
jgi:NAD(P)-dependent dehydrogenase (short-subunit alcohol dehydrogenase family)